MVFIHVIGVRFPVAMLLRLRCPKACVTLVKTMTFFFESINKFQLRSASSLVAQMAHNHPSLDLVGSNPTSAIKALVAQLVEHLTCNEDVIGSNPIGGSFFNLGSSTVEPPAVNRLVVGSNPTLGAI